MIRHNHRWSEDFDFFSYPGYNFDTSLLIEKVSTIMDSKILDVKKDTLIFMVDGWLFSFFSYPYRLISGPRFWKRFSIYIAGDRDIAAMKGVAIIQRGSRKDFYDLYFLMNRHKWTLNHLIRFARAKYGKLFDEKSFLRALVYFEDAEMESYPEIDSRWDDVKEFFIKSVRRHVRGI